MMMCEVVGVGYCHGARRFMWKSRPLSPITPINRQRSEPSHLHISITHTSSPAHAWRLRQLVLELTRTVDSTRASPARRALPAAATAAVAVAAAAVAAAGVVACAVVAVAAA